jgi:hypothetical protein
MSEYAITQIGKQTWWARKMIKRSSLTEFEGNCFVGPNAERQVRKWVAEQEQSP